MSAMLVAPVTTEAEAVLTVRAAEIVAEDVVALTLSSPDDRPLPEWTPGAHLDLVLGEDLVRQYSLCGSPGNGRWRIAVLRAPDSRGGSVAVHHLAPGGSVRVRGPRNQFPLIPARSYVFVAGGIGITPLLPMIAEVDAAGAAWELHYGGRTRGSMAFTDELARYGDRVRLVPQDEAGLLDVDRILGTPRPGALVYACGPEPMLAAVEERCARWLPGSLHVERFAPRAGSADVHDGEFEVELARSGKTLRVPADRSIFDVVREAGVSVLGSCLEGVCGTCETEVVDGVVDHRDSVLDDAEREAGETMMICVSRCRSARLTLDL